MRTFLLLFIFLFLATSAFSEKPETVKNQNIIREDNHYDNSNLKIKKSFHIYVSFKFINQPLQLEETYGLKKLNIYYHGHLIIKDSTKMYVANLAKIKEIGEYYKDKTDELVCFDIEKWKFRYNDSLNNYRSLLNFLNVVKTFREQAPETMFGFYGQFPQRKYWDPVLKARGFPSRCNEWQKLNEYIRPATEYVNVIMPSLYTFYKDRNSWVIYARENMNEAKKYNKPVYPFLWPQYHQNKSKKKPVDCEFIEYDYWKLQLETVYKYADGVIIWVPRGHVWDEEKEWWRATKEILSKINKDKNQ